jgi:lipopolysaccharide/colanic/teichoic acid biosynthesis glycosyltransferase
MSSAPGIDCLTGLRPQDAIIKRGFDIVLSSILLCLFWWVVLVAWVVSTIDTGMNGFFTQERVGRYGRSFRILKIRTMRPSAENITTVTCADDVRITSIGRLLRKSKIDELPQLWNVLIGDMSFVGPRPDVKGFADTLVGEERLVLTLRPGITGPATLKYRNEEELLASVSDPERYNMEVIFPDKVRINMDYVRNYSLIRDIRYLYQTLIKR